jgi:AcrR family transcriptional regulator
MAAARDSGTLSPQAEARREKILAAALQVMSRKGFHQTSIADISAGARVSRAAVYQYFRDKRDVLAAIAASVEQLITGAVDAWAPLPAAPPGDPGTAPEPRALIEQLRLMIDTRAAQVLAAIAANADAARLVLRQARGVDKFVDDAMRRIDAHVVGILRQDVQTAIDAGWARSCDAQTIARYLLGGVQKLLIDALDPEQPLALDTPTVVREIGALVFFGLAHPDLLALAAGPQRPAPEQGGAIFHTHEEGKQH